LTVVELGRDWKWCWGAGRWRAVRGGITVLWSWWVDEDNI